MHRDIAGLVVFSSKIGGEGAGSLFGFSDNEDYCIFGLEFPLFMETT